MGLTLGGNGLDVQSDLTALAFHLINGNHFNSQMTQLFSPLRLLPFEPERCVLEGRFSEHEVLDYLLQSDRERTMADIAENLWTGRPLRESVAVPVSSSDELKDLYQRIIMADYRTLKGRDLSKRMSDGFGWSTYIQREMLALEFNVHAQTRFPFNLPVWALLRRQNEFWVVNGEASARYPARIDGEFRVDNKIVRADFSPMGFCLEVNNKPKPPRGPNFDYEEDVRKAA